MTHYNSILNNRQSIRLKRFDYSIEGSYFITLCVQDKIQLFGEIIDEEMNLNEFGKIAEQEWLNTLNIRNNIELHEFIVMPDHFHAIIEITFQKGNNATQIGDFKSPSQTIGSIIRGYKIATTKQIKDRLKEILPESYSTGDLQFAPTTKIWQRNYYEHIIRSEADYNRITEYIRDNPANWKKKISCSKL